MAAAAPDFKLTTRLVARALGTTAEALGASLRPVTAAELPRVLAFRRAHVGERIGWDDARYLAWRYDLGTPGAGFGDLYALWRGDEPLGIVGNERMRLRRGDRTIDAQRLQDLLIRPDLGDSGLAVWLNQVMFPRAPLTIAVGGNEASIGVVRRLFAPVAPVRHAMHPIRVGEIARRSRRLSPWLRPLAPIAGSGLASWHLAQRALRVPGVSIEVMDAFDEHDQPWPTPAPASHTVVALRTGRYLNRRTFANPRVRMHATALRQRGQLLGYAVWCLARDEEGQPDARILEWGLAPHAAPALWSMLWSAAVSQARAAGCTSVNLAAQNAAALPRLRRHGFLMRAASERHYVGVHAAPGLDPADWVHDDWCLTEMSDDRDEA